MMEANSIASPAAVHPGQHLVIPRYRSSVAALRAADPRRRHRAGRAGAGRSAAHRAGADRPASMSSRPARRSTASRGFTASRSWCWPRPTTFRPTPWSRSATASSFRKCAKHEPSAPVAARSRLAGGAAAAHPASPARNRRTVRGSPRRPRCPPPRTTAVKNAQARRHRAGLPLAGARQGHRRFRSKPNGVQNDGINLAVPEGHAGQGGSRTASSLMPATSSRATAIWCWCATATASSPPTPMPAKSWSSAATAVKRGQVIAKSGADRQRQSRRNCTSRFAKARRRSIRRSISTARETVGRSVSAAPALRSIRTPSRPARSCTYCQATRPERDRAVVAHSSASRRRSSPSSGMR